MRPSTSSSRSSASDCSAPSIVPCPLPKMCDIERSIHLCADQPFSREHSIAIDGFPQRRKRRPSVMSDVGGGTELGYDGNAEDDYFGLAPVPGSVNGHDLFDDLDPFNTSDADLRKQFRDNDGVMMQVNGEDDQVLITRSALFPGEFVMFRNQVEPHPQSASPTRGSGAMLGGVAILDGSPTINGMAALESGISRCPPTASLADVEMSPEKSSENWRSTGQSSSSPDSSLPLSPATAISSHTFPSTATYASRGAGAGDDYYHHHYGPYPDIIPAATPYYQPPSSSNAVKEEYDHAMKGWDGGHQHMQSSDDELAGSGGRKMNGQARMGPNGALLGGANAKVPEDKQRQRVVQACEKCRERKAACNGHVPCKRCTDKKLVCVYAAVRRMRGPNKVKKAPGSRKEAVAAAKAAKNKAGLSISVTGPSGHIKRGSIYQRHERMVERHPALADEPPLTTGTMGDSWSGSEPDSTEMRNQDLSVPDDYSGTSTTPMMATPSGFVQQQIVAGGAYGHQREDEYGEDDQATQDAVLKSAPSRPNQLPPHSPMFNMDSFPRYPGSSKIPASKRLPGSPMEEGNPYAHYQTMSVPVPASGQSYATSYFDQQPYGYQSNAVMSHSFDGGAGDGRRGMHEYYYTQSQGQSSNSSGSVNYGSGPYSNSFPEQPTFMYQNRFGQHAPPTMMHTSASPLSPGSRSVYSTPMVGPNATLLESPLSEDPPAIGLAVPGATYSHAAQSHVRSASMSSARLHSATLNPQMGHSPLGLVGTTSPRPESGTGMWNAVAGVSDNFSRPLGSPFDQTKAGNTTPAAYDGQVIEHTEGGMRGESSMRTTPDRDQAGAGGTWQEPEGYFNVPTSSSRW